jgi:peptidoglycan hydrolase-like protein with peptidoglycan-binding domain
MKNMLKTFLLLLMVLPIFASANNFIFNRNLSLGSVGQDVLELQKILNNDLDTQIASAGPGSKNNETDYFGPLTENAVIRFQNKYRNEILVPASLGSGTGFVGQLTRNKLNSTNFSGQNLNTGNFSINQSTQNTPQNNLDLSALQNLLLQQQQGINIVLISKNTIMPGEQVGIYLSDIDNSLELYVDDEKITEAINKDGAIIIDKFPNIQDGVKSLTLRKDNYTSRAFPIKIISEKNPAPIINSLKEGDVIVLGQEIIVEGQDFSENMKIISSFGVFDVNTISENKISFKIELPLEFRGINYNYIYDGYLRIQTEDMNFSDPLLIKYSY